jgi:hypothetical protein
MSTIITLKDQRGNEVDFSIEFDSEHRGLISLMLRARKNRAKRAFAACGAIKVKMIAERLAPIAVSEAVS